MVDKNKINANKINLTLTEWKAYIFSVGRYVYNCIVACKDYGIFIFKFLNSFSIKEYSFTCAYF